jgi:tetratricopeptide (TPR) repeat protein
MPKKINTKGQKTQHPTPIAGEGQGTNKYSLLHFPMEALVLAVIGLIFYANTFSHEAAFDDRMAITSNEYVQRGVAGIPDILTHDAYESYLEQKNGSNQLAGGRYRPLSLITFAIEQQLMGINEETVTDAKEALQKEQMHVRHVINVLLYILSAIALLYLFRNYIFPNAPVAAFLSVLLFTIHPIHIEVVANVKSRDEILSVLFIALTFIQAFRYKERGTKKHLILALVYYFLALLSKEYAVTFVALLPLGFYLFKKETIAASMKSVLPYLIPLGVYFLLRFSSVTDMAEGAEQNIMNNPYLYATGIQKIATKLLVMLYYIKLLILPHPLAADYSYNQIPYTDFSNPLVWLSVGVYIALVAGMVVLLNKRHPLSFAIAFYLFNLALICNLFFNVGAPMGERLVYHSSLGFTMVAGWMLYKAYEKIKPVNIANGSLAALMLAIIVLCGFKTINRNKDWKNDTVLFITDVKTSPNSVLVNNNAAAAYMSLAKQAADPAERKQNFEKAIAHFNKVLSINPTYTLARLNRGLCYFNMGNPDKALPDWDTVRQQNPLQQNLSKYTSVLGQYYFNKGMQYGKAGQHDSAAMAFGKGTTATPLDAEMWYNAGYAHLSAGRIPEARHAIEKCLQLAPGKENAMNLYGQIKAMQK